MNFTDDRLFGGRLRYRQTIAGHRTGIEPVLLAAAVPATSGHAVIEAGTGAGAGLLCLAHRVRGIRGIGIEKNPFLAGLAAGNARVNGMSELSIIAADIAKLPLRGRFDHAFANPPWRDPRDTASPDPGRRLAYRADSDMLPLWIGVLAALLRDRGSLTLIVPVAMLGNIIPALERARCGSSRILPLWPRAGRPAKLMIVQAFRNRRGPFTLLSGLILHTGTGFSPEAEAILREGGRLAI